MTESEKGEYTLGIGKLLGLFFLVVVLCAISFGFGYTYGRSSKQAALPSPDFQPSAAAVPAKPAPKPPTAEAPAVNCPEGQNCQPPGIPSSQDLSFYKSVKKKDAGAPLSPPKPRQLAAAQAPAPEPAKTSQPPAQTKSRPADSPVLSGVMVQVAAVSRREDAEALQEALRRKQYPAVITSGPGDRLFHVQVGPFTDSKEAETTRSRLQREGYSPILKR
jgi:hypothetical protein